MTHIGFTGTRHGMTPPQHAKLRSLLLYICDHYGSRSVVAHHGDCIGADAEFHDIVRGFGCRVVGHIPVDQSHRAFCQFDEERAPLTHMQRNREIVRMAVDHMFATPYEHAEMLRGGTWATIRMARKANRNLTVVYPDGSAS